MRTYSCDLPRSIGEARGKRRSKIDYNKTKELIDSIKIMLRRESDYEVKKDLISAGMLLNKILLRT